MRGKVKQTFVDGHLIYDSGKLLHLAAGRVLLTEKAKSNDGFQAEET
jgi:hypothetical protein